MPPFAIRTTKFFLNLLTRMIQADVRLHNVEVVKQDHQSIIFTVNHFTRLETILLPYEINKHTNLEPYSLAAGDLFRGRVGDLLRALGTISTKDPDRDKIIINSLLKGDHPWIIFPEGLMVKDKKLVNAKGVFQVYDFVNQVRRAPHTGAAVLALRTEFYRQRLKWLQESGDEGALAQVLEKFDLDSTDGVPDLKTVIIPVNITYYPIRAHENLLYNIATSIKKNLSERALEELSVESTIIAKDSDVDIVLGEPIDVREFLDQPGGDELTSCNGDDIATFEEDPRSFFTEQARRLMQAYMSRIYELTTINFDHIFATVIRYQTRNAFTERAYRNRIFLSAYEILQLPELRVHTLLRKYYRSVLYEDPSPHFHDFLELCLKEKVFEFDGEQYAKNLKLRRGESDFHSVRRHELTYVIANEIEPLPQVVEIVKKYAQMPRKKVSATIRELFIAEDQRIFDEDFAEHAHKRRHPKEVVVGRPFLLQPRRIKAGIVLVHGYLAAPLEVRALGDYLCEQGYVVYGVRLKGHGTAPEDLALTQWEEWYESLNRGYAVVKSFTDDIYIGGFSTGGALALLAAARKRDKIQGVFSINAPLNLRNYAVHLIPSVHAVNTLLSRFNRRREEWEFIANEPENEHINYRRNPVTAIRQLNEIMDAMEESLGQICVPTLIVQGSRDSVVDPSSAQMIFHQVGTRDKELVMLERDRHGIVNGPGSEDVFDRVHHFIDRVSHRRPQPILKP